jgi:hypothetical protein
VHYPSKPVAAPSVGPQTLRTPSPVRRSTRPLFADNTPPTFRMSHTVVTAEAEPGAGVAKLALPAEISVYDAVPPRGATTVTCTARIGGKFIDVVEGLDDMPHGTTLVTCFASDAAGNRSPPESFAFIVSCRSGYSFWGGKCQSELTSRGWMGFSQTAGKGVRTTDKVAAGWQQPAACLSLATPFSPFVLYLALSVALSLSLSTPSPPLCSLFSRCLFRFLSNPCRPYPRPPIFAQPHSPGPRQ